MSMCAEREKKKEREQERECGIMLLLFQLFFWIWNSSSQCPHPPTPSPPPFPAPPAPTTTTSHPSNNKHRKLVSLGGMDRSWKKEKKKSPVMTNGQQEVLTRCRTSGKSLVACSGISAIRWQGLANLTMTLHH